MLAPVDRKRPFLGLQPFQEEDQARFHGRKMAIQDLFRHVRRETLTVLFGRSGLGKTSLLQAGLFPVLREARFFPMAIRLDQMSTTRSLLDQVRVSLAEQVRAGKRDRKVDARPPNKQETLWEYFHQTPFWNNKNHLLTPVLVFDQFEDFFIDAHSVESVAEFREALADLVENRIPDVVRYNVEEHGQKLPAYYETAKIKVILSLREVYLADLEGLRAMMPAVIINRYRLTQMSGERALEAIQKPAGHLIDDAVAKQIVRFVAGAGKRANHKAVIPDRLDEIQVEPSLLSLFCFELNERRIENREDKISARLLKGSRSEILEDFYQRTIGEEEKLRVFVEDRLLTKDGYRTSVALTDALERDLDKTQIDRLVGRRLLRMEDRYGTPHVVIIHDVLREPIQASRDRRCALEEGRQQEKKLSEQRWKWVKVGGTIILILIACWLYTLKNEVAENLALQYQDRGRQFSLDGDYPKALVYLSEAYGLLGGRQAPGALRLLLARAMNRLEMQLHSLEGHTGAVFFAAFSSDGNQIVTVSKDQTARVWNARTGEPLTTLKDPSVVATTLNNNGHQTANTGDAKTGESPTASEDPSKAMVSAAFISDGNQIKTVSKDQTARVWNAKTGKLLKTHKVPSVAANKFNNNDHRTANTGDAKAGESLTASEDSSKAVVFVAFSPDRKRVFTTYSDQTAKIWDAETDKLLTTLKGHGKGVLFAAFSPDGDRVVTASSDRTAKIWDAKTGERLTTLEGHSKVVLFAAFNPDGDRVVTTSWDQTAKVWDAETGGLLNASEDPSKAMVSAAFSSDGNQIVTVSEDQTAKIWDAKTGKHLTTLKDYNGVGVFTTFSPKGKRIITKSENQAAKIWDAETGEPLTTLEDHSKDVVFAAFNPDGDRVVTTNWDETAKIWDAETGKLVTTLEDQLEGHSKYVVFATFSPDGDQVVTASWDETAKIWNTETGELLKTLEGHSKYVVFTAFSPDGERVVTASWDQTARIWSTETDKLVTTLKGHSKAVAFAAFSPDGDRVVTASSDRTAKIWDAKTGKLLTTLESHSKEVVFAAFNPDGDRVVTASWDQTAKIWDAETGELLTALEGHSAGVVAGTFNRDSDRIVTISRTAAVRSWDVHLEERSSEKIAEFVRLRVPYELRDGRLLPREAHGAIR